MPEAQVSHMQFLWGILRDAVTDYNRKLTAIGPKPIAGEEEFIITFPDGVRLRVKMEDAGA